MIVRRLFTGVLLAALTVPMPAAAEPETSPPPAATPVQGDTDRPLPPPVASSPSPEIAARARAEFESNRNGKIDRSHYTPEMSARITDAALAEVSAALKSLGSVKAFNQVRKITNGGVSYYVFRVECEKPPPLELAIGWDAAGKIGFLQFGPAR